MPIYEYKLDGDCPFCPNGFERLQELGEPALTHCELCGIACRRVISKPAIQHANQLSSNKLSSSNLEQSGMARWERASNGEYVRTAGTDAQGPRILRKDGSTAD